MLALSLFLRALTGEASAEEALRAPTIDQTDIATTRIDAVRFLGVMSLPVLDLTEAVAPWLHRDLTFDELREMAGAVTGLYRRRGYMVAGAYLGNQTIRDNILTITVVEGRLGQVRLRSNATIVPDQQILETIALNLCPQKGECSDDRPIRKEEIERAGILASEIPGVRAKYELTPGTAKGSTDIIVDATPTSRFNATVGADNNGFAFTGRNRVSLALSAANLAHRGDLLSLSTTYTGKGFFSFALDGSLPVGYSGARGGLTAGHLRYALGREFAVLGATGVSDTVGFYWTYPVIRTLVSSMDLRLDLVGKKIGSDIETLGLRSREGAGEAIISISGSRLDHVLRSGSLQYRLSFTQGNLRLSDPASRAFDAATAGTEGAFGKLNYLVRREELLLPGWTAFAQLSGQQATTNLDSSEKFPLGGSQAVRAYDTGAASADNATLLTVETRLRVPTELIGGWEMIVAPFYDHAWATFNDRTWPGFTGSNKAQMAGAGLYVSLARPGHYSLRATYAKRVRISTGVVPGGGHQIWVEAAAAF
jgi:hemolysin activation/secretion protein